VRSFRDKHFFVHDKTTDYGYISGNPLIYTALFEAVGGTKRNYSDIYFSTMVKKHTMGLDITLSRSPVDASPTSLDEIIGAWCLDLIGNDMLQAYGYRWHDVLHSPSYKKVLKAALECYGKDRNYFKDNNIRDLHPIAYYVSFHVQYMLKPSILLAPFFYTWLLLTLVKPNSSTGNISQKNIAYAVLKKLGSKHLIKLIDHKRNINAYFKDADHPIRRLVNA